MIDNLSIFTDAALRFAVEPFFEFEQARALSEIDVEQQMGLRFRQDPDFSEYFLTHLLIRTARVEADLVDQLSNSSEMRLARAFLLLANYGNDSGLEPLPIEFNQGHSLR
jgi:hypothetical protein